MTAAIRPQVLDALEADAGADEAVPEGRLDAVERLRLGVHRDGLGGRPHPDHRGLPDRFPNGVERFAVARHPGRLGRRCIIVQEFGR